AQVPTLPPLLLPTDNHRVTQSSYCHLHHLTGSTMLKPSASCVLASFRPSTYPGGYASGLHSLRPCWTSGLSILPTIFLLKYSFPPPTKLDHCSSSGI